jgi:outer membrane lipoprotein-sorting protein
MGRIILIVLCLAVFASGCVASATHEVRFQDPNNSDYSITFYSSGQYPEYDGTFEINEDGNIMSGRYVENPNSYSLYMSNGLGSTIPKTDKGIQTLEGFEWIRS